MMTKHLTNEEVAVTMATALTAEQVAEFLGDTIAPELIEEVRRGPHQIENG